MKYKNFDFICPQCNKKFESIQRKQVKKEKLCDDCYRGNQLKRRRLRKSKLLLTLIPFLVGFNYSVLDEFDIEPPKYISERKKLPYSVDAGDKTWYFTEDIIYVWSNTTDLECYIKREEKEITCSWTLED